ncbi:MAG: mechanosensitive ion channel family protein [bacterium]|nr:mechanosensitive ion channel family protein [bacterium]
MAEFAADTISHTTIPEPTTSWFDFHQIALNYLDRFFNLLPNIFLGLVIFLLFYLFYRFLRIISARALSRTKLAPSVSDALLTLLKYSVLGYGLVLALEPIFPRITSLLVGLGILGIAIGFAAKDTLANLIAGLSIFWDKPFEVGDIVTLDGTTGKVDRISLRSTRLVTAENYLVSIPNQSVINNKVINLTRLGKQRIAVSFPISFGVNMEEIQSAIFALIEQFQQENRILAEPKPQLVVTDLKEPRLPGIVQIELWVWVDLKNKNAATVFMLRKKILGILQNLPR